MSLSPIHSIASFTSTFACGTPYTVPLDEYYSYDSRGQELSVSVGYDEKVNRYDGSGNRTVNRELVWTPTMVSCDTNCSGGGGGGGSWTLLRDQREYSDSLHNRLRMWVNALAPADSFTVNYLANGARGVVLPWNGTTPESGWNGYQVYAYDGQGRSSGMGAEVGGNFDKNTNQCRYGPMGALRHPCENTATDVWYDGANPVGTTSGFTFVQGPGVDDPLVGDNPTMVNAHLYYVTDGQGRQYAVGDSAGWDATNDSNPSVYQAYALAANGGKYAGGTASANGFGASRFDNAQAPGISFFRNRFYDQATGRWTQEDPLGVAGGLNLYAYVGNNPASYTDPFGLCTDKDGKELPKDKCSEVSAATSQKIATAARHLLDAHATCHTGYHLQDGSQGPNTDDCNHFVFKAMANAGVHIPIASTSTILRSSNFERVSGQPRAGDILLQPPTGGAPHGHMGVFSGSYDAAGRPLGYEMGGHGAHVLPFGPGGDFNNGSGLVYLRPVVPKEQ